jgi:hypothetical protein
MLINFCGIEAPMVQVLDLSDGRGENGRVETQHLWDIP